MARPSPRRQPRGSPAPEGVSAPGWEQTPRQPSPAHGQPSPRGDGTQVTCCTRGPPQEGDGAQATSVTFLQEVRSAFGPHCRKTGLEVLITIQAARWSEAWTHRPRTPDDSSGPARGKDGPLAQRAIINNACPAPASSPTHPGHVTKQAEETNKEP